MCRRIKVHTIKRDTCHVRLVSQPKAVAKLILETAVTLAGPIGFIGLITGILSSVRWRSGRCRHSCRVCDKSLCRPTFVSALLSSCH